MEARPNVKNMDAIIIQENSNAIILFGFYSEPIFNCLTSHLQIAIVVWSTRDALVKALIRFLWDKDSSIINLIFFEGDILFPS